jgi:hypothetical protein
VRVFVPSTAATTFSADDGSWLLEGLPEGQVPVTFFAAGYAPASSPVTLSAGQTATVPELSLAVSSSSVGDAAFSGVVRSAGRPVGEVLVEAAGPRVVTTRTGAAGEWGLSLGAGVYDFTFLHEGFAPVRVHNVLATGEPRAFDVELSPGDADAGAPVGPARDAGTIARTPVTMVSAVGGSSMPNGTVTVPIPSVARAGDVVLLGLLLESTGPYFPEELRLLGWKFETGATIYPNGVIWASLRVPQAPPTSVEVRSQFAVEWLVYVLRDVDRAMLLEGRNTGAVVDFQPVAGTPGDLVVDAYASVEADDASTDGGLLRNLPRFKALELPIGAGGAVPAAHVTCKTPTLQGYLTQFRVLARP